jgi:hypothetical protein
MASEDLNQGQQSTQECSPAAVCRSKQAIRCAVLAETETERGGRESRAWHRRCRHVLGQKSSEERFVAKEKPIFLTWGEAEDHCNISWG